MNNKIKLLFLYTLIGVIFFMAIVIPTSKMLRTPSIDLVNNNAIDELQFDLDEQIINQLSSNGSWKKITYGRGTYVAVGTNIISYSSDGFVWTDIETTYNLNAVFWGAGRFVAVGQNIILYSSDGSLWNNSNISALPSTNWLSVAGSGTRFIAVGSNVCAVSNNAGGLWNTTSIPTGDWNLITSSHNRFIAVGIGTVGQIRQTIMAYTAQGGYTFTLASTGSIPLHTFRSIAAPPNPFITPQRAVVVGGSSTVGYVAYSINGTSFTSGIIPSNSWQDIAYGNGMFVAVGEYQTAYSIDGGMTFELGDNVSPDNVGILKSITYADGVFLAIASIGIVYSTNGVNFISVSKTSNRTSLTYQTRDRNDNPFKIDGNELLTTNTQYQTSDGRGLIPMTEYIAEQTINIWYDGRMTVNLETYYTEFLDESGKVVYNGKDGRFPTVNDIIILWDLLTNQSYIKNPNGSARKFKITSSEFELRGIARINIKALEVK